MVKTKLNSINQNNYYANLLKDAYSGEVGETFSLLQFQYFSYVISNFENEFTSQFYMIAQDDLEHHSMLGECIVKLGGDPTFISSKNIAINGNNFEYVKGIKQMILQGIEIKEKTIINYKILIAKISEKEIKNILEIILTDEQKHKEILENMLKKYENN